MRLSLEKICIILRGLWGCVGGRQPKISPNQASVPSPMVLIAIAVVFSPYFPTRSQLQLFTVLGGEP